MALVNPTIGQVEKEPPAQLLPFGVTWLDSPILLIGHHWTPNGSARSVFSLLSGETEGVGDILNGGAGAVSVVTFSTNMCIYVQTISTLGVQDY